MKKNSESKKAGPVLLPSELASALIEIMKTQYPQVDIIDRGGYIRLLVPHSCRINKSDVEEITGRDFYLPQDLEAIMPSFQGRITLNSDYVSWETA